MRARAERREERRTAVEPPMRCAKRSTGARHEAQGRAESDAARGQRIRGQVARAGIPAAPDAPKPRRHASRRLSARPGAGGAAQPPRPRPCMRGGVEGRKPTAPNPNGRRTEGTHPPPDVYLRRGADPPSGGRSGTGGRLPSSPTQPYTTRDTMQQHVTTRSCVSHRRSDAAVSSKPPYRKTPGIDKRKPSITRSARGADPASDALKPNT